jgi:hypothetical protein
MYCFCKIQIIHSYICLDIKIVSQNKKYGLMYRNDFFNNQISSSFYEKMINMID